MNKNIKLIISKLVKKKINLSCAESCTGGMLAQNITSVSGASKVFTFSIVTYSNQSKIKFLKISPNIIKKNGAVSKECCFSMLKNLEKISKAKLNLVITGIAGPNGGTKLKPVGLVYIGIKRKNKVKIEKHIFINKNRENIRKNAVKKSLELINKFI